MQYINTVKGLDNLKSRTHEKKRCSCLFQDKMKENLIVTW